MKRKLIALAFTAALLTVSMVTTASAVDFTDGWKGCTPLLIGPANGDVMVKLSCTDGESGWAMLSTTGTDQMMASILTAMSLQKPVSVWISGTATETGGTFEYSVVKGIQLSAE